MPHRYNRAERLLQAWRVKEPVKCFHYRIGSQVLTQEEIGAYLGEWIVGLAKSKAQERATATEGASDATHES